MEQWLRNQRARIDLAVIAHLPSHWPTLGEAYARASNSTIAIEALVGLLAYRPGKQLSEDSIQIFAAVQIGGIGMRMLHAANSGLDPDKWIAQWGPLLAINYAQGFIAQAKFMMERSSLPTAQRQSLRNLLDDTFLSFFSAQDTILEATITDAADFENLILRGQGAQAGLGLGVAAILQAAHTPQLQASLTIGQWLGQALHRLQLRHLLDQGQLSETGWLWTLLHGLAFAHDYQEELRTVVQLPQQVWDHHALAHAFQAIGLPHRLLEEATRSIAQATALAVNLPEHEELCRLLWALVGR